MFEVVADRPAFGSNISEDNGTVSVSKKSGATWCGRKVMRLIFF